MTGWPEFTLCQPFFALHKKGPASTGPKNHVMRRVLSANFSVQVGAFARILVSIIHRTGDGPKA